MNRAIRYLFSSILCFVMLLITADCFALRCGDQIVERGDDMNTVDGKCGRPDVFSVKKIRSSPSMLATRDIYVTSDEEIIPSTDYKGYYSNTSGGHSSSERSDEEWIYNCGSGDFAYTLIFENNVLVRESTQRGYGLNKCISGDEKLKRKTNQKKETVAVAYDPHLCMLRGQHMAKALELFPNENNITTRFEMYRQKYMTDKERQQIPLFISSDTDPCKAQRRYEERTKKKNEQNINESESGAWFRCKDKDGNVTLSNVGCSE